MVGVPGRVTQQREHDDHPDEPGRHADGEKQEHHAPQATMGTRLFHTSFMLVPMARSVSSSIGTAKTLIAKAKAANSAPTALPTSSSAHPSG